MPDPTPPSIIASLLRALRAKDLLVVSLLAAVVLQFRAGDGAAANGHAAETRPPGPPTPQRAALDAQASPLPPVTAVVPPTYARGAPERTVFDALNTVRARGNFGLLVQDERLDAAAAGHAAYMALNLQGSISHLQDPRRPGFSGATPQARILSAGYDTDVGFEAISSGTSAAACLELLNTVYHLGSLMAAATDVGIAVHPDAGCVVEPQRPRVGPRTQPRRTGTIGVYPYPGQAGVPVAFMPQTELPNPAPDLGDAVVGPPILVDLAAVADAATTVGDVVLSRLMLTEAAPGSPVTARILARPGVVVAGGAGLDLHLDRRIASTGQVFLLPLRTLKASTVYAVDFSGAVDGVAVTRRWEFTTR